MLQLLSYFDRLDLRSTEKPSIADCPPQCHALAVRYDIRSTLPPYDTGNVDIAERDDDCRHDEYVTGEQREVRLALPPGGVAQTPTLVFDLAVRINAHRHLKASPVICAEYFVRFIVHGKSPQQKNRAIKR